MAYIDCCDWDKCTDCGECLVNCPVLQLDREEAKREIMLLKEGKTAPRVFSECTLCLHCNTYCPIEGLRPHELILQRITEQKDRKTKVPALVPFMLNSAKGPNFFRDFYEKELNNEEKAILEKWSVPPQESKDVLFIGCLGKTMCKDIENSRVLKDLPKFGPPDLCCGELHYRTGMWNAYAEIADKTLARFKNLKAERIVFYCTACRTYLGPVLSKVYGKEFPFKMISLYEWLLEKYEQGEIEVKRPIKFKAAVHDFCNSSELGQEFQDNLRKIYKVAGVEIKELEHNRNQSLSCGAVTLVRDFGVKGLLKTQMTRYKEVKDVGMKNIAVNCPGCFIAFSGTSWMKGLKPRYMVEELLRAFGDDITIPMRKRILKYAKVFFKRAPIIFKKIDPREIRIQLEPSRQKANR